MSSPSEESNKEDEDSSTRRWYGVLPWRKLIISLIGLIMTPIIATGVVQVKDALYPTLVAPSLESSVPQRVTDLENQVAFLASLLSVNVEPPESVETTPPQSQVQQNSGPEFSSTECDENSITVENDSKYEGRRGLVGRHEWDWKIFLIIADDTTYRNIDRVTYKLHPTFDNPIQVIRNRGARDKAFPLSVSGAWGTFVVEVTITCAGGGVGLAGEDEQIIQKAHQLHFVSPK